MEAKQFAELLKSPLQVAQLPVDALRELVKRYPFSASLQMLLLKQFQLNDHPAYDEQLPKAAIYAPDRRALYRLVQLREMVVKEVAQTAIEPEHTLHEEEGNIADSEVPLLDAEDEDASIIDVEPISFIDSEQAITDEEPLFTDEEVAAIETDTPIYDEAPASANAESSELDGDEKTVKPLAEFSYLPPVIPQEHLSIVLEEPDEKALTEEEVVPEEDREGEHEPELLPADADLTANAEIVSESTTVSSEPAAEAEVDELAPVQVENTEPTIEVSSAELQAEPITDETASQASPPKQTLPSTDSFTGWLQRVKRNELPKPMDADDHQEKAALDALFGAGTYEATLVKESIDLPEIVPTPKVPPTREELMEPDDEANRKMDEQAKKSLTMGNELVTETLARIYEIQKKNAKAIEAYEILKVRFPEKVEQYNAKIQSLREI